MYFFAGMEVLTFSSSKIIKIYIKFNKFLISSKPVNTLVFCSLATRCAIKLRLDKSIVYIIQEVNLKTILVISKLQLSQITGHFSVSPAICLKICRLIYLTLFVNESCLKWLDKIFRSCFYTKKSITNITYF